MIDIHHLINLRGYGNAEKELRKAGLIPRDKIEVLRDEIECAQYDISMLNEENDSQNCDHEKVSHFAVTAQFHLENAINIIVDMENHK